MLIAQARSLDKLYLAITQFVDLRVIVVSGVDTEKKATSVQDDGETQIETKYFI